MSVATKLVHTAVNWGALTGHTGIQTVTYITLHNSSNNHLIAALKLNAAYPIAPGAVLDFAADTIVIQGAGAAANAVWGDDYALAALDAMFGSGTPTTIAFRLWILPPASDGTGGTEFPATGNYTQKTLTNNSTNFPAATMV